MKKRKMAAINFTVEDDNIYFNALED